MSAVKERFIVNSKGEKREVILPVTQYERLLEDLHDFAVIAERRKEKTMSLKDMKKQLKIDGLL